MPRSYGAVDLEAQARKFASSTSHLLNNTVAHGVRISAVLDRDTGNCWVGRNITAKNLTPTSVPLTLGQKAACAYLHVAHILQLDHERRHLMNTQSTFGLYLDEGQEQMLLHYDYLREPAHVYPEAHFQVSGDSPGFTELGTCVGVKKTLERLHFPVGGRRFRPTLEDLIEFLIVEGFAEAHDSWQQAVTYHRATFARLQLMAAVRRNPDVAREALSQLDTEPDSN